MGFINHLITGGPHIVWIIWFQWIQLATTAKILPNGWSRALKASLDRRLSGGDFPGGFKPVPPKRSTSIVNVDQCGSSCQICAKKQPTVMWNSGYGNLSQFFLIILWQFHIAGKIQIDLDRSGVKFHGWFSAPSNTLDTARCRNPPSDNRNLVGLIA